MNFWNRVGVVCGIFTLIACASTGLSQDKILFSNCRVFDGEKVIESSNVLVVDGKIESVGKNLRAEGAEKVPCDGKTLLPGLIDTHVHAYSIGHLKQAAEFGVTTELDMMSFPVAAANFRAQQRSGLANDRADLFSAGFAVTVEDGHGTQFGFEVPTLDSHEQAGEFVTKRIREGSDYIKIIYEDGKSFGMTVPTLDKQMLEKSIIAAKDGDKLAVAHIGSQPLAQDAVDFGINGLVHLFAETKISDDLLKQMKEKSVFVTPTAAVITNTTGESTSGALVKDKQLAPMLNNENIVNLMKRYPVRPGATNSWDKLKHNIKTLHDAGIPILAGTDAPNPGTVHGASMHHELELLVAAGLTPVEALTAATSSPAKAYSLNDRDSKRDAVAAEKERAKNPVVATESLTVSDFEDGKISAKLGAGWSVSTDQIMGGKSKATTKIADDGANSKSSMLVQGNVQATPTSFAGAMLTPGAAPMQPGDISGYKTISFWSKSDSAKDSGSDYAIMFFTRKRGMNPSIKTFTAKKEWQQHSFAIKDFDGCDGSDVLGVWFGTNALTVRFEISEN